MKARHVCAILGVAAAAGAVVFMQSLAATNDAQASRVAQRLLAELPVPADASVCRASLDFRPGGRVMQGPPMSATIAASAQTALPAGSCIMAKSLFAQRRIKKLPAMGEELTFVGRRGAFRLKLAGWIDWERPVRGYPSVFVSAASAAQIPEEWSAWKPQSAEELAPSFMSDSGRSMDRAKPLLLWAAALTALCLLLNSLYLSIESRRREIAVLRMVGMTRGGAAALVFRESFWLSAAGFAAGAAAALAALCAFVAANADAFPSGMAVSWKAFAATGVLTPAVGCAAALLALRPALSVKPLEAANAAPPRRRRLGMFAAFACGFGAFVAVEVWGSSLTKPFIPSKEWPDAIVSILPGGVSAFDIDRLKKLPGVRKIAELQPLQVNFSPLEEMPAKNVPGAGGGRGKQYRNALLLASDWLPDFRFVQGTREEAEKQIATGDFCVISEMTARARGLAKGSKVRLDCGGYVVELTVAGVVDLNWHMVTSRGLVRGLNRMPMNTDGPFFVSFDTLAACDRRPQEFVKMTHVWLDYEPTFLAAHGAFAAGRLVERAVVDALEGAWEEGEGGEVLGNAVRLHSRDEVADGTAAHAGDIVGAMARVPFVFLAVISIGFVAMLAASADARRREFRTLRAVGATRWQIAKLLSGEALKIAAAGIVAGAAGGAAVGWLCTAGTRAAMANWGLPACFVFPAGTCAAGAAGAVLFALAVAVPASLRFAKRAA